MTPQQPQPAVTVDSGLLSLALIARFHQIPADSAQLAHQFAKAGHVFGDTEILRSAKSLKLKAKAFKASWDSLVKAPLPAIGRSHEGEYFIIAKVAEDQVLVQRPGSKTPEMMPKEAFLSQWPGHLILVTKRAPLLGEAGKFDISWFIPALLRYKKYLVDVVIASFFIQMFALVSPLFFQVIVDKVLVHRGLSTLDVLAFGLLVISFFDVLLNGLRTYIFSHTTNRVDVTLGAQLFNHLVHLPIAYYLSRQVGNTVARVRELDTIRNFITSSALTLVLDIFFTLVFFAVMYYYSPKLTAIVALSIPVYAALSYVVSPILRARLDEKFKRGAENQAFLTEAVTNIETVKSMSVEPQMQRKWEEQIAGYVASAFKANTTGVIASQIAQLTNKVVTVLLLWVGATAVMAGELTIGQLIAFNMIAGQVSAPILRLVQLWQDFQQVRISIERLGDILNTPKEMGQAASRTTMPAVQGRVTLDNVIFRYAPTLPPTLKSLSLDVKPGEVIGIVGRSGSGKSTLTKLVQRLYVPESGHVRVDGVDIAQIEPTWLRRQIGVVQQENRLFNRSIKDNIALADPGTPIERVIAAAKLAGAHEFIVQLSEGYDTLVGEQGASLSGGQRQRIAIARALISNPRILIFDEATSALDYESERIIQDNMHAICQQRTVFIIAHRLSTVRGADRIVVVDQGQIVEMGNHDQLIAKKGYYAKLHDYQNAPAPIRNITLVKQGGADQ